MSSSLLQGKSVILKAQGDRAVFASERVYVSFSVAWLSYRSRTMLPSVIYPGSPAFANVGRGSDAMEKVVSAVFRWDLGKTRDKSYWQGLSRGELDF